MEDILHKIEQQYEELSPQLRLAARFALDSPDRIALYSMREVAARAEVLPPTMLRLARRLGFETYNEFRDMFRARITPEMGTYAARARQLQLRSGLGSGRGLPEEVVDADTRNIEQTFLEIDDTALQGAATCFIEARVIHIVGLRKCYPIAFYFHYATRMFFPAARLIEGRAGLYGEEIARIGKHDAVLVVAFDPYTKETVQAAKRATETGARLIAISDSVVSPLAEGADYLFLAANRSPTFYRSLVGAMSLIQALVAAIVRQLGDEAISKLAVSEAELRDSKTYWQNGEKA
jgi:DNA-binding MurR/RpiR family transcriptional regulator